MANPSILGPLSSLHEMMGQLLTSVPANDATRQYHPELGSLCWYLGRSVYQETYWLRQVLTGDEDLSQRVEHLFTPGARSLAEQCAQLPPVEHLLNWAVEIQDEHLTRLANPGLLPEHPLMKDERLAWLLLQEQARNYERMLQVLNQRQLHHLRTDYAVERVLTPTRPQPGAADVTQGHYRVGARDDAAAYDNELPPQAVELSYFRIGRRPVSNSEYLTFMQAGGYENPDLWSDAGRHWLGERQPSHPEYWRQDAAGHWFGVGINGPSDLPRDEPVSGISQHEATAYAAWAANLEGELSGAVLQHEYQWEVAARTGALSQYGRVQEWCANPFHPYPDFQPFPDAQTSKTYFDRDRPSLRGASLHAQRTLRRLTCRDHADAAQRTGFTGLRLVFPAGKQFWE